MHTVDQALEVLLDELNIVIKEQISDARERHPDRSVLEVLREEGTLQPRLIYIAIARFHRLGFADLADENVEAEVRKLKESIPGEVARRYHILPLQKTDHSLRVAIGDTRNFDAFDEVPFLLKAEIEFLYADPDLVESLLGEIYLAASVDE